MDRERPGAISKNSGGIDRFLHDATSHERILFADMQRPVVVARGAGLLGALTSAL